MFNVIPGDLDRWDLILAHTFRTQQTTSDIHDIHDSLLRMKSAHYSEPPVKAQRNECRSEARRFAEKCIRLNVQRRDSLPLFVRDESVTWKCACPGRIFLGDRNLPGNERFCSHGIARQLLGRESYLSRKS